MKIVLFLNKDLEAAIAYNLLKDELLNHNVRVYYSDAVGDSNLKYADLLKLEYFEQKFVFQELPKFISANNIATTFEFFGEDFKSFPIQKCVNPNSVEFINALKNFEPDLFISIRYGKIFRAGIINVPKKGILNLHSGILPDFKGIMGALHAIKTGRDQIGCTLHTIPDQGIDTGEIIEIADFKIDRSKSLLWHIVQLYPLGVRLILKSLTCIEAGNSLEPQKQNLQAGNYFSVPSEADFAKIRELYMEIFSESDYAAILKEFILKELTWEQNEKLTRFIVNSGRSTEVGISNLQ